MSHAAQAYARTSHTTTSPREIEAQALLKAARQLQDVQANWSGPDKNMHQALLFNRRLWSIFMSAAETNENPQPMEIRQNIANIGVFVLKQTIEMQINPDPAKLKSLIDINCNIAPGPSGPGLRARPLTRPFLADVQGILAGHHNPPRVAAPRKHQDVAAHPQ